MNHDIFISGNWWQRVERSRLDALDSLHLQGVESKCSARSRKLSATFWEWITRVASQFTRDSSFYSLVTCKCHHCILISLNESSYVKRVHCTSFMCLRFFTAREVEYAMSQLAPLEEMRARISCGKHQSTGAISHSLALITLNATYLGRLLKKNAFD